MKFVMDIVVKIIQCLYANLMNHCKWTELLKEIKDGEFNSLMTSMLFWLSCESFAMICCKFNSNLRFSLNKGIFAKWRKFKTKYGNVIYIFRLHMNELNLKA